MNQKFKYTVLPVIVLFLHLYLVGTLLSIVMITFKSEWSMDKENTNSIGYKMEGWKSSHILGMHSVKVAFSPSNDEEKQLQMYTWILCPFVMVYVFFGSPKSWGSGKFKNASDYGSHGSSRWAKRREIFKKGEITGNPVNELDGAGIILGYEKKVFGKKRYITLPPDGELNNNVMVYGNSGIGKGYTYLKTQIFHTISPFEPPTDKRREKAARRKIPKEYSLFVTDPKGELYEDTAQALMDAGYEVYAFNLVNMAASHRWNPNDYIEEDLDAQKLANLLISQPSEGSNPKNDFWEKAEKALMSAIILFVKYELDSEQVNLSNVLHIGLTYGRDEDTLNMLFDALPYNHPAVAQYNIFRVAPDETRAGILIGFGTQISLFGYKKIAELSSQSDFRFDEMAKKKTALFLIIPDADTTYAPLTSLFFNQAIQQWWKVADENGGTCPVGIRILADELPNVGKIPMLGKRTSVMRSKGISIQIVVQAKSQLYDTYDKEADTIIQNCDTVIFLGTNDKKTAEELSNDLGDMTIRVQSTSQQQNSFFTANPNLSEQYQARKLMDPSELRRATRKLNIIVQNGGYPFKTIKTPFTEHPNAKKYKSLDPKAVVPPPLKGFSLFSQEDYNNICGLTLKESNVDPEEATNNFRSALDVNYSNGLDLLDKESENVYYTEPIEQVADSKQDNSENEFFGEQNQSDSSVLIAASEEAIIEDDYLEGIDEILNRIEENKKAESGDPSGEEEIKERKEEEEKDQTAKLLDLI